jgi:hypothetical protein
VAVSIPKTTASHGKLPAKKIKEDTAGAAHIGAHPSIAVEMMLRRQGISILKVYGNATPRTGHCKTWRFKFVSHKDLTGATLTRHILGTKPQNRSRSVVWVHSAVAGGASPVLLIQQYC